MLELIGLIRLIRLRLLLWLRLYEATTRVATRVRVRLVLEPRLRLRLRLHGWGVPSMQRRK